MSNTQWTDELARRVLTGVMNKAKEDSAFREVCLENPGEAFKSIAGVELPAGFKLNFVDNKGADLTVVLPDLAPDGELSEQELEDVAGGGGCAAGTCGGTQICGPLFSGYCLFTCGGTAIGP